jgi:hypothetical protein
LLPSCSSLRLTGCNATAARPSPPQPVNRPADAIEVFLQLLPRERLAVPDEVGLTFLQSVAQLRQAGDARREVLGSHGKRRRDQSGLRLTGELSSGQWEKSQILLDLRDVKAQHDVAPEVQLLRPADCFGGSSGSWPSVNFASTGVSCRKAISNAS